MAKRTNPKTSKTPKTVSTAVRNTAIPKPQPAAAAAPAARKEITWEMISQRAYDIWSSGQGGSDEENWLRAERELRGA